MLLYTIQKICYTEYMIKSFKHKGLENFFKTGNTKGIQAQHTKKLQLILMSLNVATNLNMLNIPTFRIHALKGDLKDYHAITVQANWRVIFKFENEDVYVVDYLDYH